MGLVYFQCNTQKTTAPGLRAGWVAVQTQPFGRLTVRLERRSRDPRPVIGERRRGVPDAWQL